SGRTETGHGKIGLLLVEQVWLTYADSPRNNGYLPSTDVSTVRHGKAGENSVKHPNKQGDISRFEIFFLS
ncbi:MAG: hypothetical protein AB2766_20755, partial [Candidatus Thiodiazotropha endolucinida]